MYDFLYNISNLMRSSILVLGIHVYIQKYRTSTLMHRLLNVFVRCYQNNLVMLVSKTLFRVFAEQAGLCFTWSDIPSQNLRERLICIRAVLSVFDKTVLYIRTDVYAYVYLK